MIDKKESKTWKPKRPRFIVDECKQCSNDRKFQNGKCVYNQNLGMAYSVDEIVEVFNLSGESDDYLFELMQEKIWYCQAMYHKTSDKRYKIEEECLKTLRDERHNRNSIFKYTDFLKEYIKEKGEVDDV